MKTAHMITAALILSASVSALAQQSTSTAPAPQESKGIMQGKTRAEIVAELQQAEAEGKGMPTSFVAYDAPAKSGTASSNTAIARK